jgi:dsDNA-specific endonuclease/ATPase MutS2
MMHIDSSELEAAMREKKRQERQDKKPTHSKPSKKPDELIVQDLHIAELIDNLSGLSHTDMLNCQLDKFREVMEANKNKLGQKIVFIHGKGEGVLRRALLDELRRRYPRCAVQDASFREYGFGATQVTIHK